jgi:site-specific DNA recombinase
MQATQERAVKYLRISEDKLKDEHGVTNQDDSTGKLIADRGWELVGRFKDNDISATKGKPRPEYHRLMAAAQRGEFDRIVVFQLSRLWRNRRERAEGIEILSKAKVSVTCVKGAELRMGTAQERGMVAIIGEFDTMEAEVKGERTRAAQEKAAQAGLHLGGSRPFGWDLEPDPARKGRPDEHRKVMPVINEAEAEQIRHMAKELLRGASLGSLVRELTERGFVTTRGKPWTSISLRVLLTRPRNYGCAEFAGDLYPGAWPAIIDEPTHSQVVALLADPVRRTSTGNQVKYLLSGIATCSKCKTPVKTGSASSGAGQRRRRVYKCPDEHLYRAVEPVDYVAVCDVLERLEKLTPAQRLALLADDDPASPAVAQVSALRAKIAEALAMWKADELTRAEYKQVTAELRPQLQAAERKMATVSRMPVVAELLSAEDVRAAWEALPFDRKRSVLRELIQVTILPGIPGRTLRKGLPWNNVNVGVGIRWRIGDLGAEDFGDYLARTAPGDAADGGA